ncbi:methyltransferase [Radiobacillus sp. PE A8.2]|uniref:methyltransferase n=1 Tax=Radiobacillus sp. PE A8.2 TaxID=3380349 RepID=UPI00388FF209
MNKEHFYDKLLNIKTEISSVNNPNPNHYHPYEPTPYLALEDLFKQYEVKSSDKIVDFGCGKGRVNFYINYFYKASVVGVEMVGDLYQSAQNNIQSYTKKHKFPKAEIQFHCSRAEEYPIDYSSSHFYFFNPFSIQIFMKIVNNILLSYEQAPRQMELLLYYPSKDYIDFIDRQSPFELKEEIILEAWYPKNPNERFLIYRFGENHEDHSPVRFFG